VRSYLSGLLTNYLNLLVRMLAGVIVVPLLLHSVGKELAGIYFLLMSISNFVSIGIAWLSHAGTKLLADAAVKSDQLEPRVVHQMVLQGFLGYSLVVALILVIGALSGGYLWGTTLTVADLGEARWAVVLVACFILVTFINCANVALLNATFRQHSANIAAIASQLLFLGSVFFGLRYLPRIDVAMGAQVLGALVPMLGLSIWLYRRGEILRPTLRISDRALFRRLVVSFGGRYFVYGIGEFLLMYLDLFLIAYLLGPTAVAAYVAVVKLPEFAAMLLGRISEITIPYLARIDAAGDLPRLREGYLTMGRFQNLLGIIAGITFAFLGQDIVRLWIGNELAPTQSWLYILAGAALTIRLSYRHDLVLFYAMGRVGQLVVPNLIELGLRCVAVILLASSYGIGAALLSYCVVSGGLMIWWYHARALRTLDLDWRTYGQRVGVPTLAVGFVLLICGFLVVNPNLLSIANGASSISSIAINGVFLLAVALITVLVIEHWQRSSTLSDLRALVRGA